MTSSSGLGPLDFEASYVRPEEFAKAMQNWMPRLNSVTSSYGSKGCSKWVCLRSGPFNCVPMLTVCVEICSDGIKLFVVDVDAFV